MQDLTRAVQMQDLTRAAHNSLVFNLSAPPNAVPSPTPPSTRHPCHAPGIQSLLDDEAVIVGRTNHSHATKV